jgi:hypothetical protein
VRAAHHHWHTYGADSIRHAVRLCYHPSHCADPDKSDVLFANEPRNIRFIHRSSVAIDQQNLMARRGQRLKKKHPEVRHEIPRHAIVRVVE